MYKYILFDLDGTLLRSDKTISKRTLQAINQCRARGFLVGISTSRAEHNCMTFLPELIPDLFIASGGAVVKFRDSYAYTAEFSIEETQSMIACARESRASGMPTISSAWAAATACSMAVGLARPTSSLAWAMMRRAIRRGSTPA